MGEGGGGSFKPNEINRFADGIKRFADGIPKEAFNSILLIVLYGCGFGLLSTKVDSS